MRCTLLLFLLLLLCAAPARADSDDARLRAVVERLRRSSATLFGAPLFPRDAFVESFFLERGRTVVYLGGSWDRAELPARLVEVLDELRLETWLGALTAAGVQGGVEVRVSSAATGHRQLGGSTKAQPARPPRAPTQIRPAPRLPQGGALSGKRIAISPGHGWLLGTGGVWATQRDSWSFTGCGTCRGITEDFYNAEVAANQLIPLLQNMGAEIILVRDPDLSLEPRALVDDADASYSETGTWSAGANTGGWNGGYRTSAPGSGGAASFKAQLANPGLRHLGVRWLAGANRTTDAVAEVRQAGGSTFFDLDQTLNGSLFLDLGRFWFAHDAELVLSNGGAGYLVADAVKLGGGVFPDAAEPWWQMAAETYVPWTGADASVTAAGDVTIRPLYASAVGADLYLSFHGNASGATGGSSANGTSTYRYSCQKHDDHTSSDAATDCDYPPGSKALIDVVHASIVARVRAEWDPNWGDRGKLVANFGELRVLSATVPGVLVESAFFDNLASPSGSPPPKMADNKAMHDPRWRETVAFGIADALASYLHPGTHAPPGRPDGLRAINHGDDGSLAVGWRPVPAATGYLVYTLADPAIGAGRERAFDAGRFVATNSLVVSDLDPRKVYGFRVAAVDANGVGLASQCVAVRFRGARHMQKRASEALYVGGYDRRDAWVQEPDNDFCYAIEHGQALAGFASADVFFDGALREVVEDGTVPLAGYRLVDYAAGKNSVADESISTPMQALLSAYLDGGGKLLLSGEEIGWDLVQYGSAADQTFVDQVLGAGYVSDSGNAFTLHGAAGGPFDGLGDVTLDDGTKGVYQVRYPDVLSAKAGTSVVALTYPTGSAAAVASSRVIWVGAGLEAVVPADARAKLFERAVQWLIPGVAVNDLDLDGASDSCEQQAGTDWRDSQSTPATCAPGEDTGAPGLDAETVQPDAASPGLDAAAPPDASEIAGLDVGTPPADAGLKGGHGGCGCASAGGPAPLFFLALVLWTLALLCRGPRSRSLPG